MADRMVVIRFPDGREGAVLPEDFADEAKADNFEGARIVRWEDGTEYDGPTTPEGMARREEREAAAEDEPEPERPVRRAREPRE